MKRFLAIPVAFLAVLTLLPNHSLADDKEKDPDQIGNRDVGKGVNFYSLEKEIAIGKQLSLEVERQSKIVDDPVIAEYVNRIGQNLVRNSDAKVPFTIKVLGTTSNSVVCAGCRHASKSPKKKVLLWPL